MDLRDRKGKGVAPIQPPRTAPTDSAGRGEASSSRMPPPPPQQQQQQQRPIQPVLGRMPPIPPVGLWDEAQGPVVVEAAAAAAAEVRGADLAAAAATLRSRLEEVRSQLRQDPMALEKLAMSPESSPLVVHLLLRREGGEEMRQRVLDGFVNYAAHSIMGNEQGHAVFAALLGSVLGRRIELEAVVGAVPDFVWMSNDGMSSLKLLITAVCRRPGLHKQLVDRFVREDVIHCGRGHELIVHCFSNMDYEASKFLIRHALRTIRYMLESASGLARLVTCFRHARPEERWCFQGIVFKYAVGMAMGRHSNYFVQLVLDHGDIQFRSGLVSRLMMQFASLSLHPHGNYVVQHCVRNRRTGSPQHDLLPIVLNACNRQSIRELQGLVQNPPANFVLHTLLQTGNAVTHSRELTQNLERIINDLLWRARRYSR